MTKLESRGLDRRTLWFPTLKYAATPWFHLRVCAPLARGAQQRIGRCLSQSLAAKTNELDRCMSVSQSPTADGCVRWTAICFKRRCGNRVDEPIAERYWRYQNLSPLLWPLRAAIVAMEQGRMEQGRSLRGALPYLAKSHLNKVLSALATHPSTWKERVELGGI